MPCKYIKIVTIIALYFSKILFWTTWHFSQSLMSARVLIFRSGKKECLIIPDQYLFYIFSRSWEQMDINWLVTLNGVRWHGHVLKRDDDSVWGLHWILKWVARESRDDHRRPGRSKWKRRQRRLVWRRRMPWIEQSGEIKCDQLQKDWGESSHLCSGENTR